MGQNPHYVWVLLLFSRSVVSDSCDPMDGSPPGFSVQGILQARILERVAISSSRGSSQPRDRAYNFCISCAAGLHRPSHRVGPPSLCRCLPQGSHYRPMTQADRSNGADTRQVQPRQPTLPCGFTLWK